MTTQNTIWLIDDDPTLRLILEDTFSDAGLNVVVFSSAKGAWAKLNDILHGHQSRDDLPDVILTDIRMPMMDGLSFSEWVHNNFSSLPIVIMTAHSDLKSAVDSYQTGAFEYLPKPFDLDDAVAVINKAIGPKKVNAATAANSTDVDSTHIGNAEQSINSDNNLSDSQDNAAASEPIVNTVKDSESHSSSASGRGIADGDSTSTVVLKSKQKAEKKKAAKATKIIGQSQAMQNVFRAIGRLAQSPITVLITGESGTGKELVAGALHEHSPRHNKPFIALNMAAIPHDLIESELFGHEKGAFTGATTQRKGRFEQADGGTLFLDEIGDMPYSTQTRLLRVLADGEFFRVGGQKPIKVDVRIVAATHQNLERLVKEGKFREDLFYRLNVIRLPLPPLRQRRDDIPELVAFFMERAAKEMNAKQKHISDEAMSLMQAFDWSGNVRQIENACRWITVMATGDVVTIDDLPPELTEFAQRYYAGAPEDYHNQPVNHSQPLPNNHLVNQENLGNQQNYSPQDPYPTNPAIATSPMSNSPVAPNQPQYAIPNSNVAGYGAANAHNGNIQHKADYFEDGRPLPPVSQVPGESTISTLPSQHTHQNSPHNPSPTTTVSSPSISWQQVLKQWASEALQNGETDILQLATPEFERVLVTVALDYTKGRKGEAADILGWGRNTLTRKIKLLDLNV